MTTAEDVFHFTMEFLNRNRGYCETFVRTGGKIDMTLNGHVDASVAAGSGDENDPKSKVFEMTLHPDFLSLLNMFPLTFTIQMWK